MTPELKTKLLAFFAATAPPVPTEERFPHGSPNGYLWYGPLPRVAIMSIADWSMKIAKEKMEAFEKMLEATR